MGLTNYKKNNLTLQACKQNISINTHCQVYKKCDNPQRSNTVDVSTKSNKPLTIIQFEKKQEERNTYNRLQNSNQLHIYFQINFPKPFAGAVNILCAIWYHHVSGIINYTAVYPN